MNEPTLIVAASLEDLRSRAAHPLNIRLVLNGGLYSRKTIRFDAKNSVWRITNHIDDTKQTLTDEQLWSESNIGKGLDANAILIEAESVP